MFSARKATPHQAQSPQNQKKKFKANCDDQNLNLFNRSFDTAQNLLEKNGKNMRQTRLCLIKKQIPENNENHESRQNQFPSTSKKNNAVIGFTLMLPKENLTAMKRPFQILMEENLMKNGNNKKESNCKEIQTASNLIEKTGRNKRAIMGKVDYCLKIHKLYPNVDATWDIYGKIIKILTGKNRGEHILLLRAANDRGPIMQSIYYDFENTMQHFSIGTCVRAVGEFMNENRLRTFQLEKYDCEKYESEFSRIQNVTSFALLQEKE